MSMTISTHDGGALVRGLARAEHPAIHLVPEGPPGATGSPATRREAVICSFHTTDDYYAGHAAELRGQLDGLGLAYQLLEVDRTDGEDWADVTRRKIGFIRDACQEHPDAMVFWIDVDCRITHLPDYVRDSTADIIGFQRSFRSPLQIGYHNRTRFWEPSFWGVNATAQGRKLIDDAFALEQRSDIKATDDYFLEEAWRANAAHLTFQMLPSTARRAAQHRLRAGLARGLLRVRVQWERRALQGQGRPAPRPGPHRFAEEGPAPGQEARTGTARGRAPPDASRWSTPWASPAP